MASAAAQLLDELMGTTRNAVPGEDVKELKWSDEEVCKHFLCGFCPSELFVNTKAEATVGSCYRVHDDRLKKAYEESTSREEAGYEDLFLAYLERLVRDLDRKVDRGKERLRRSAQAKQQSLHGGGPGGYSSEKLKQLSLQIDMLVRELEYLGEQGRVEETHALMMKLESLEKERECERMASSNFAPKILAGFELDSNDFHEKMELCDVCGSFLVIGDTQSRVDAHLLGKQHIGFARIRTAIADLKLKKEERYRVKQEELAHRRQEGEDRSQRRHSHRGHSRERRRSHRSRSRERSRRGSPHNRRLLSRKSRSHSRDKKRSRSRSRGRKRSRSQSKTRQRSCSQCKGSRSSSKDRKQSCSHCKSRKRSHSKERPKRTSRSRSKEKSGNKRNGMEDAENEIP